MFTLAKLAVLLTATISVAAMPSHLARQGHHHRELAARVAQPEAAPVPEVVAQEMRGPFKRIRKRAGGSRCKPSGNSLFASSPSPTNPQPSPSPTSTPTQSPGSSTPVPEPSTSTPNQPEPTTTTSQPSPDPTSTSMPTPTPTSGGNNNGGGQTYTGEGTFYATGLGACGITNNDGQFIAAVSHLFFDSYPGYSGGDSNTNPLCGKVAQVTYGTTTISVSLTDRCTECAYGDLDFSPTAFNKLADPDLGRIRGIQWQIVG